MTDLNSLKTIPEQPDIISEMQTDTTQSRAEGHFFNTFKESLKDTDSDPFAIFDKTQKNPFSFDANSLMTNKSKRNLSYWIFGIIFVGVSVISIFFLRDMYEKNTPNFASASMPMPMPMPISAITKPIRVKNDAIDYTPPKQEQSDIILEKPSINSTDSELQNLQNRLNEVNHLVEAENYTQALEEALQITSLFSVIAADITDKQNVSVLKIQHYNTLSEIYYRLNKPQKGVIYSDKALKQALVIYNKQSPNIAKQYDLMAFHLDNTGQFDRALQYRYDAIQMRLAYNDPKIEQDMGKLVTDMNNLGEEYRTLGYFKQSQEILVQAIGIVEKKHGIDAPELIVILNNLGLTHQENNNKIIGLAFLQQAYLMAYKHYGKDNQLTILIGKNITRLRRLK